MIVSYTAITPLKLLWLNEPSKDLRSYNDNIIVA